MPVNSHNSLYIGKLLIDPPFICAPMAGVTGHPYRMMMKKYGASLVVSEMISARALVMGNKRTSDIAYFSEEERPFAAQIFGNNPALMTEAAKILEDKGVDIIDVNMGCPVPKVLKTGSGAAFLKNIENAAEIINKLVNAIKIPVTAKTRIGWSNDFLGMNIGKKLQEAGVSAITYHARTCTQKYSGQANWERLKILKKELSVPIIGSGDIFSGHDANDVLKQTGIDGVMIARGGLGNPWIFKQAIEIFNGKEPSAKPSKKEKISACIELFNKMLEFYGPRRGVSMGRKHILWFLKGLDDSHKVKDAVMHTTSANKIVDILVDFQKV